MSFNNWALPLSFHGMSTYPLITELSLGFWNSELFELETSHFQTNKQIVIKNRVKVMGFRLCISFDYHIQVRLILAETSPLCFLLCCFLVFLCFFLLHFFKISYCVCMSSEKQVFYPTLRAQRKTRYSNQRNRVKKNTHLEQFRYEQIETKSGSQTNNLLTGQKHSGLGT